MKYSALLLLLAACLPGADIKASLAPTGTLRVTFLGGNPVQGRVDSSTGTVSGLVREMSDELARRLGVNEQTMRRWVAGESVPETQVFDDLLALVDERVVILTELRDALVTRQGQERGAL